MKQRLQATHFLEQYNTSFDHHFGEVHTLDNMQKALQYTALCMGIKTVAVWKIKFKTH